MSTGENKGLGNVHASGLAILGQDGGRSRRIGMPAKSLGVVSSGPADKFCARILARPMLGRYLEQTCPASSWA